ncbi:MAG TPA: hypothetical protein VH349_13065 [Ktedonobacterales bacterium]|jgi:hypothetical protein
MIEQDTPDCTLGLTTEALSAWRDGGFRGDEEQRIRQHATTCAACQQRLDGFATVARALERQQELEPGDRVWRSVQDGLASQTRGRSVFLRPSVWSWQGVAAVASVILVVGLLAAVLNALRTPSSGLGSVIILGPRLAWQAVRFPPGVEITSESLAFTPPAVAPSDGNMIYLCVAPAQGETNAHIYITRDRGQTWTRGGDLLVGASPPSSGNTPVFKCSIGIDATRPDTAIVDVVWDRGANASGQNTSLISSFASIDYGVHWRKLVFSSHPFFLGPQLASHSGATFAFWAGADPESKPGLWVSYDQMMSWQALPVPSDATVNAFWLNPSTGALLLTAFLQGRSGESLFTSVDGGVRWTQLPTPSLAQLVWTIQAPQGEGPWQMCGSAAPPDDSEQPRGNTLICSNDGGQTWITRPALNLPKNSLNTSRFATAGILALTSDGAALATSGATDHIYRLTAGDTIWQDLGPEPAPFTNPGIMYFPTPTGGTILMFSTGSEMYVAAYSLA